MKALSFELYFEMRSRQDCVASREDIFLSAIAFATAVNDINAGNVDMLLILGGKEARLQLLDVYGRRVG